MEESPVHEVNEIHEILQTAKKYSLEAEVVWSALESMKLNPDQTIVAAMMDGLNEWIR
jgi:hypothetical protein